MKNRKELYEEIMSITMNIDRTNPELLKYLEEMPEKISGKSEHRASVQSLIEYYNSLCDLLTSHASQHQHPNN